MLFNLHQTADKTIKHHTTHYIRTYTFRQDIQRQFKMYKLDLPVDYKEAAAIERRRNQEEQRKSRIFNAKTRLIGVDKQAIDQQLHDRKQTEEYERRRDEAFGKAMLILSVITHVAWIRLLLRKLFNRLRLKVKVTLA